MTKLVCLRGARAASTLCYATANSIGLLLALTVPSYAIPSPDLVVGSISSISQLIALASAMIGGGAVVVGARAGANASGAGRSAKIAWRIVGAAALCLIVSLGTNFYQFSSERSARQARLEASILRPTETTDGHTLDPELKEASYRDQIASARGITTAEMERLLADKARGLDPQDVLVDVREPAETQTGMLPNATPIRFPDFVKSHADMAGKTAILYCDNGNRSFETCQRLAAMGIDCRFMVGGLQKWLAEHRPFAGKAVTTLADFRALKRYPNRDTLLDTPEVHKLVAQGATFVDVRYPGEFRAFHLPGAVNLPIRPTLSAELHDRIAALPHKPIVAPCYDTRSCFYAEILGSLVAQAGGDFRGRYTVPWEYYVAQPPRAYIQQYLDQIHKSSWRKMVDEVALGLAWLGRYTGFLAAIVLLALLSRLSVLPFSLKAERDQVVSRDLSDQVDDIKQRLKSDPRRLARGMRAFYRRHGLTPMRNLLGLAFLPVMSVCVAAVHTVAEQHHQSLLWAANAASHDPTYILPLAFAALICVYMDSAFVRTSMHRILIWSIGMVVLTATGMLLSVAADAYLVVSAALLLIQRAVVTNRFSQGLEALRRWRSRDDVISLDEASRLSGCGNKAYRLAVIRSKGFTVPQGVVLTADFLQTFASASASWRSRELDRVWRRLGAEKAVVRSSGSAEDGSANSFAGVFESVLNVNRANLEAAVAEVLASFSTAKTAAYGVGNGQANILVQRMIEPDYSGVLFTRDLKCPSHSLVELVEGTADKLVSGTMTPVMCRFGRISGHLIGSTSAPIDLQPLVAIGQQLEGVFGGPQDIEWAYAGGCFYIVQSRDITRVERGSETELAVQAEWSRALDRAAAARPDEIAFEQNEMSEVLPRPTPLSLSLMESMWASGGSIDLACRRLGLGYQVEEDSPRYLATIFGRLYVSKPEEVTRAPKLSRAALARLNRMVDKIRSDFSEEFLPAFRKEIAWQEAVDFDRLPDADLLEAVQRTRENYVCSTGVAASVINIAADYYLRCAKEGLVAAGMEPARYLAHLGETEFEHAIAEAKRQPAERRREALLQGIGHRATVDYELAVPRYAERPSDADPLFGMPPLPVKSFAEISADLARSTADRKLREMVLAACSYQTLKEDAKHHSLREIAVLRRVLMALDRRFDFDGLIFQLTFEEIATLNDAGAIAALRSTARARQQQAAAIAQAASLGATLTVRQIEEGALGIESDSADEGRSSGVWVSGSGTVEGRACVVRDDDGAAATTIPNFRDGDIVVSRMVPPAWIPYFQRAGGFVCEVGGWLSHTAIVAREFNVPLIVQAKGIRAIESGMPIRLHPDGAVEILAAQSSEAA